MRPGTTVAPATSMVVGVGARVAHDLRARAARDDATVVDGERLDDAEVRVDGQDLAVRDDGVDVLLRECRGARECGEDAESEGQVLARRAQAELVIRDIHVTHHPER